MRNLAFLVFSCLILLTACTINEQQDVNLSKAKAPDSWISERVAAAQKHLQKTEAGQLVWDAMEAHGGLANWYENGALSFQFNYQPLDGSTQRNTVQQVALWNNRTRHQQVGHPKREYGWDGEQAWITPGDTAHFAYNTRFWSLTPIYFLGQPFVFDGEGVQLERLPDQTFNGQSYNAVKVSFAAGTGDAPDDYYIAYFDPTTKRQEVIRYIVSYPGYFEKGKHLPEKFMTLHDFQTVDGITLPTAYRTHWTVDNQPGEHITDIAVSQIKFMPDLPTAHFEAPAGVMVLEDF